MLSVGLSIELNGSVPVMESAEQKSGRDYDRTVDRDAVGRP